MFRVLTLATAAVAAVLATSSAMAQPWRGDDAPRFAEQGNRGGGRGGEQSNRGGRGNGRWSRGDARPAAAGREQRLVPLPQVIEQVRRRTPGRLLDAGVEGGDRPVYRVRWAGDDGRRVDYVVDAESGRILSAE